MKRLKSGTIGKNRAELLEGNKSILVRICLLHHFLQIELIQMKV
jgi:hypothetical protein